MKKYYIITLIILAVSFLFSASPVVSNVLVTPQTGSFRINYDLVADGQCQVNVIVSSDGGTNFDIVPTSLSGHVGNTVMSGSNQIIWRPSADNMEVGTNYMVKIIARDNPIIPTNPLGAEEITSFVKVDGGTFNYGTADVTLSDFYMSKYEVTQAEYEAVIGSYPDSEYGVGNDYPVYDVSWNNAVEYCNVRSIQEGLTPCYDTNSNCDFTANGYRLPTEMEWMYAAKGGNQTPATGYNKWAGTDIEGDLTNYAWYSSNNSPSGTKVVGTKLPNQLGIYDMSGNVWEWCNDWYGTYPSGAQTDPVGPTVGSYRVLRGGCWYSVANRCRVAIRNDSAPANSSDYLGFRLARSSN